MTELEQELRERTDVDNLIDLKIESLDEGRAAMEKVDRYSKELINELRDLNEITNPISEAYNHVRYDLKTARHNMHVQMARFVKLKHHG